MITRLDDMPPDPQEDMLIHVCWVCGEPTGAFSSARDHIIQPGQIGLAKQHIYRDGLCPMHDKMRKKGHTAFISNTRGVMLELKANAKIQPQYRGQVIHIPEEKMDELLGKRIVNESTGANEEEEEPPET